jgi:uncharacterized protein YcfL
MNKLQILLASFVCILFGCATEGPYVPAGKHPGTEIENTAVIMDAEIKGDIAVDTQHAVRTPQGKLKALANIRNRTNQDLTVQVQTVFRNEGGFSIEDDTSWETIVLTANSTHTYISTSTNRKADLYTVRIRLMR